MQTFQHLFETIESRKKDPAEGSYTAYLFTQGLDKILKKVGEECAEVLIASKNGDAEATVGELSDLIYHLYVLMAQLDIPPEAVYAELDRRSEKQGNLKKSKVVDKNS